MSVRFRPKDVIVGDTIPFFWEGKYHVFYLKGLKTPDIPLRFKTSLGHLISADLLEWEEFPVALEPGPKGSPDATGVWHGNVIKHEGIFHLLYTGYNSEACDFPQTICHATSKDLINWEKDPNNPLLIPDLERYENRDWRDPWVFWNEEEEKYWMLITARRKKSLYLRRGCLVLATSNDLLKWRIDSTFFSPDLTFTYEASQLFKWGEKWYLLWHDFMMPMATYYRIGDTSRGPWKSPPADRFDGPYFYGGKVVEDESSLYSFQWIPTRFGDWDTGYWEWGGDMGIPRQIVQKADGSLDFKCPSQIVNSFSQIQPVEVKPKLGKWEWDPQNNVIVGERLDGFAYATITVGMKNFLFETTLTLETNTTHAGILFKAERDLLQGFMLRFDPTYHRVVIDHWPLPVHIPWSAPPQSVFPSSIPFFSDPSPLVEQPLEIICGKPIKCLLFISYDIIQLFIDDSVTLTYRVYRDSQIPLGLFLQEGKVKFNDIKLKTI